MKLKWRPATLLFPLVVLYLDPAKLTPVASRAYPPNAHPAGVEPADDNADDAAAEVAAFSSSSHNNTSASAAASATSTSASAAPLVGGEGVSSVQLAVAGAYRSVCVRLRIHHLPVAALEVCDLLSELEGSMGVGAAGGGGAGAESATFKALRGLVGAWLRDATQCHSPIADMLLQNLYR